MSQEQVYIDPKNIPDRIYDLGCSILNFSVRRALSDPKLRLDYEKFKAEQERKRAEILGREENV